MLTCVTMTILSAPSHGEISRVVFLFFFLCLPFDTWPLSSVQVPLCPSSAFFPMSQGFVGVLVAVECTGVYSPRSFGLSLFRNEVSQTLLLHFYYSLILISHYQIRTLFTA